MDIASISMGLARSNLLNDVGNAMLSKTLDMSENMGAAMTEMLDAVSANAGTNRHAMELSVNPDLGANIDISC